MGMMRSLFSKIGSLRLSEKERFYRSVRARFDSAMTTPDNQRHWQHADSLSADSAANPQVRQILRNRSRYEVSNNSYAKGIAQTLANYTVGTGPRLQLLTDSQELNRKIEKDFTSWAQATDLSQKLRTMRLARVTDGEVFIALVTNPNLPHRITLDLRLIEADQVTSDIHNENEKCVDGIEFDIYGNPLSYRVLTQHPGSEQSLYFNKSRIIPAHNMVHYFKAERPGQHRGISDMTPSLPLFAQLRRFTLAVIAAAESAANFAGILYTDAPAGAEADTIDPMDLIELERNLLMTMPAGWKMGQLKAEQPTTTYPSFTEKILNEIARGMGVPYGIAIGNSSGFNYASGRLDYQSFFKLISIEQDFIASRVLLPILKIWLSEYLRCEYGMFKRLGGNTDLHHQWFWDGVEHVDPAKEANAQKTRLANNTTTLAIEYARQGKDWEEQLRQRAAEKKLMDELGLT